MLSESESASIHSHPSGLILLIFASNLVYVVLPAFGCYPIFHSASELDSAISCSGVKIQVRFPFFYFHSFSLFLPVQITTAYYGASSNCLKEIFRYVVKKKIGLQFCFFHFFPSGCRDFRFLVLLQIFFLNRWLSYIIV